MDGMHDDACCCFCFISAELRNVIGLLQQQKLSSMTAQVDLGCGVFMQAECADTSQIFVDVGLGHHVAMSHAECLSFLDTFDVQLQDQLAAAVAEVANKKSRIEVAIEEMKGNHSAR